MTKPISLFCSLCGCRTSVRPKRGDVVRPAQHIGWLCRGPQIGFACPECRKVRQDIKAARRG